MTARLGNGAMIADMTAAFKAGTLTADQASATIKGIALQVNASPLDTQILNLAVQIGIGAVKGQQGVDQAENDAVAAGASNRCHAEPARGPDERC